MLLSVQFIVATIPRSTPRIPDGQVDVDPYDYSDDLKIAIRSLLNPPQDTSQWVVYYGSDLKKANDNQVMNTYLKQGDRVYLRDPNLLEVVCKKSNVLYSTEWINRNEKIGILRQVVFGNQSLTITTKYGRKLLDGERFRDIADDGYNKLELDAEPVQIPPKKPVTPKPSTIPEPRPYTMQAGPAASVSSPNGLYLRMIYQNGNYAVERCSYDSATRFLVCHNEQAKKLYIYAVFSGRKVYLESNPEKHGLVYGRVDAEIWWDYVPHYGGHSAKDSIIYTTRYGKRHYLMPPVDDFTEVFAAEPGFSNPENNNALVWSFYPVN